MKKLVVTSVLLAAWYCIVLFALGYFCAWLPVSQLFKSFAYGVGAGTFTMISPVSLWQHKLYGNAWMRMLALFLPVLLVAAVVVTKKVVTGTAVVDIGPISSGPVVIGVFFGITISESASRSLVNHMLQRRMSVLRALQGAPVEGVMGRDIAKACKLRAVYVTLAELEDEGYLAHNVEQSDENTEVHRYRLTEKGRAYLKKESAVQ